MFEKYWIFASFCLVIVLVLVRLLLRERITLQGSLSFFMLLLGLAAFAIFPDATSWLSRKMGFALPSNFFFAITLGALALLHLAALITLSRVELRTIALTQELGILRERLERVAAEQSAAQRRS